MSVGNKLPTFQGPWGTEMVSEMSVIFNQMTRLRGLEDFINFSRRESFRLYIILRDLRWILPIILRN
jgi:hypothetical protein